MPLYEHVFIARPDISSTQAEGLIDHFGHVLKENDGNLIDFEYWGLRGMAYKMNKNRKGHYCFMRTNAPSSAVQEMERLMRIHDDIVRVLTIRVEEHEEGPSVMIHGKSGRSASKSRKRENETTNNDNLEEAS
jgi:small subunit ribosomal protein S6